MSEQVITQWQPGQGLTRWQLYKKKRGNCIEPFCRNKAAKGRRICNKCKTRRYRQNSPLVARYHILKTNAQNRGHEFTLTVDDFRELVEGTGYLERVGCDPDSLQIDRINPLLGYVPGNCRVILTSDNCAKGATWDKHRYHNQDTEEIPF